MSVLYREMKRLFRHVSSHEDGRITAQIVFPKDFTGFQGHFPGNPILPGVCQVMSILVLLESALKRRARLKTIIVAKFLSIVRPEEELKVELRREMTGGTSERVKALFRSADKKIAEIHIEVNDE